MSKLLSRYPWVSAPFIVGAPMRVFSGPALAVSISRAGGLGFIGPAAKTEDTITDLEQASSLIRDIRSSSSLDAFSRIHESSSATSTSVLPIGVGFQLWKDDLDVVVTAIEKSRPCAAWLFAPRQVKEFDDWSCRIRNASPQTQIWIQIGSVGEARSLLSNSEKPDVLVIQGSEAGGHGREKDGIGLITLFPEVADILARDNLKIPLVAAGGIVDGRGVTAALSLGASGAAMGTRFLASTEARIKKGYQDEIVRASDGAVSTVRTLLYNHLRGIYGWPEGYSPRTIVNQSYTEYLAGRPFEELKRLHDEENARSGDGSGWGPEGRLGTYAGASVGLIREVKPAVDIVHEVRVDVLRRIHALQSLTSE